MYDLRLHVVPLTNEPGSPPLKSYTVTPQEFSQVIDRVNLVYAGTNIRFLFDPEFDWAPLANTEINTDGSNQRTLCNQIADAFPGKIVCFLRWGSGPDPTGNGNAYPPPGAGTKPPSVNDVVQNYVALPNKVGPGFAYLSSVTFSACITRSPAGPTSTGPSTRSSTARCRRRRKPIRR